MTICRPTSHQLHTCHDKSNTNIQNEKRKKYANKHIHYINKVNILFVFFLLRYLSSYTYFILYRDDKRIRSFFGSFLYRFLYILFLL